MNTNPFSTCFIQPGAIQYNFFGSQSIDRLATDCLASRACQLIVGPHGSGKSTLLRSLEQAMNRITSDRRCLLIQLHNDGNAGRVIHQTWKQWIDATAILVDGIEQLNWFRRRFLMWKAWRMKLPLIATTHEPMFGCKVIWETKIDSQTERWIIKELLRDQAPDLIDDAIQSPSWIDSRKKHRQNLRESLFDMYDWWQQHGNTVR